MLKRFYVAAVLAATLSQPAYSQAAMPPEAMTAYQSLQTFKQCWEVYAVGLPSSVPAEEAVEAGFRKCQAERATATAAVEAFAAKIPEKDRPTVRQQGAAYMDKARLAEQLKKYRIKTAAQADSARDEAAALASMKAQTQSAFSAYTMCIQTTLKGPKSNITVQAAKDAMSNQCGAQRKRILDIAADTGSPPRPALVELSTSIKQALKTNEDGWLNQLQ